MQALGSNEENNDYDATINNSIENLWVPGVLKKIHMKYVSNAKELGEVFASIHIFQPMPNCVLVDDYSQIISRYTLFPLLTYLRTYSLLFIAVTVTLM